MSRVAGGIVTVVAALFLVCHAEHHQEQEGSLNGNTGERYDRSGLKSRIAELEGLIRHVRETQPLSYYIPSSSGMGHYMNKRNFDEIDLSAMPFPYKRFYHLYGNNIDIPLSNQFDKKRLFRPEYPMDEIDLSYFPIGSKRRALDSYPTGPNSQ